jgi:4-hydroxy-3-methylbut-2-enyl diphosphate reductase
MLLSLQGEIMSDIKISNVCGLCAGCNRSINTAKQEAEINKTVLYKEIVHNKNVNDMLLELNIKTINNLEDAKQDELVILRAHGEPPETYKFLEEHNLKYTDCTCPNVTKIHELVHSFSSEGYKIILIGKYGKTNGKIHPEVFGTIGWSVSEPILIEDFEDVDKLKNIRHEKLYLICQTTFNEEKTDKLILKIQESCKNNNNELVINKSICSAQKSINIASVKLAKESDIMIVVGGKNSSNSIELFNNVKNYTKAIFIEDIRDWKKELEAQNISFSQTTKFGLTAGASTLKDELLELQKLIEVELN